MKRFNSSIIMRYLVIGVVLPLFVQYVFYFRFTSNYMLNVFSEKGFNSFYGNSIFRYRIIGRSLHLWLYKKLSSQETAKTLKENAKYDKRLTALDKDADETFYITYFIVAAVFTMLTALALLYLFDTAPVNPMNEPQKIFITAALVLLIGFTQFVITPYDTIGYFLLVAGALYFFKYLYTRKLLYFVLVNVFIVIATLNRESALLTLSLMAAIYFSQFGWNLRWVRFMIVPVLGYLLTWMVLRLLFRSDDVLTEGIKLWTNLNLLKASNLMGFFFAIITFYMVWNLTDKAANQRLIKNFLLMSLPYIAMIPVIGIMIEVRLWTPIILGAVMLSQFNPAAIRFPEAQRIMPAVQS
jgi:hypothetical protein